MIWLRPSASRRDGSSTTVDYSFGRCEAKVTPKTTSAGWFDKIQSFSCPLFPLYLCRKNVGDSSNMGVVAQPSTKVMELFGCRLGSRSSNEFFGICNLVFPLFLPRVFIISPHNVSNVLKTTVLKPLFLKFRLTQFNMFSILKSFLLHFAFDWICTSIISGRNASFPPGMKFLEFSFCINNIFRKSSLLLIRLKRRFSEKWQ